MDGSRAASSRAAGLTMAWRLAAFRSDPDIRGAFVTGNELDGKPEGRFEDPRVIMSGIARPGAAYFCWRFCSPELIHAGNTARFGKDADGCVFYRRADVLKLERVKLSPRSPENLAKEEASDKVADGEPVRLGDPIEMIGCN